jgi:hypothetical protein
LADIFISYTNCDRDWAFWIGHELEALGHTPHVHDWELSGGDDIVAWMDRMHHAANHILLVISNAYLDADYSNWERRAAQWAAVAARPRFALPVFVEACKVPTLLAPIKRCDLYGLTEAEAQSRLKNFLKPAVKSVPGPFPGSAIASSVPHSKTPSSPPAGVAGVRQIGPSADGMDSQRFGNEPHAATVPSWSPARTPRPSNVPYLW